MKRTLWTTAQREILEKLLAERGPIVSTQDVIGLLSYETLESKRRFVSQLHQAGWLVRIQNGVYQIADLSTLGTLTVSRYAVACILVPDCYVSFESVLQFHGLHDQLMETVASVSLRQPAGVEVGGLTYRYVKTKGEFLFGFEEYEVDGQKTKIAMAEKALVDMVQLHRSAYTSDRVTEVLAESRHSLDFDRLNRYLERANLTTQRIFGFLFELVGIEYAEGLLSRAQQATAAARLTPGSGTYNAKWRLYYDADLRARYSHAT